MTTEKDDNFDDDVKQIPVGTEKDTDLEIDIVDDTPTVDKGKAPMAAEVEDASEDELSNYAGDVQKRIKKLTRGYHDERRAKETALRERDEAAQFAKQQYEASKQLQRQLSAGSEHFISTSNDAAGAALELAKNKFKSAYDSGDADQIADAQAAITAASMRKEQSSALRPLQFQETPVYNQPQELQVPKPDDRAMEWQEENPWFGKDEEMTSMALGLHEKLVKAGVDPRTEQYYEKVNARMREKFPEEFRSETPPVEKTPNRARSGNGNVVAPATRSNAPKRISMTASQVAIAKRLGLTNEQYAHELMKLGG